MKKIFLAILFINISCYAANVYFNTPNPYDVYDGRTYYSSEVN